MQDETTVADPVGQTSILDDAVQSIEDAANEGTLLPEQEPTNAKDEGEKHPGDDTPKEEVADGPPQPPAPLVLPQEFKKGIASYIQNVALQAVTNEAEKLKTALYHQTPAGQELLQLEMEMDFQLRLAQKFFAAGCFTKDVANAEQAFVKIRFGQEMGLSSGDAMRMLYMVNGRISFEGWAALARLKQAGWEIEYKDEVNGEKVTVVIRNADTGQEEEYTAEITDPVLQKSKAMGFAPWQKLRWHGVNNVIKFYVPELLGGVPIKEAIDHIDFDALPEKPKDQARIETGLDKKLALKAKKEAQKEQVETSE